MFFWMAWRAANTRKPTIWMDPPMLRSTHMAAIQTYGICQTCGRIEETKRNRNETQPLEVSFHFTFHFLVLEVHKFQNTQKHFPCGARNRPDAFRTRSWPGCRCRKRHRSLCTSAAPRETDELNLGNADGFAWDTRAPHKKKAAFF